MTSRRHHFVAQGYLRGFSCPARGKQFVWVYDKRPGRPRSCKSVKSVAWLPLFYAQEREDGSTDTDTLEQGLAQTIDTKSAELISTLDAAGRRSFVFSQENRELLALFVGLSLTRVPSFRDGVRDIYSHIAQHMAETIAPELWPGPGPAPEIKATAKEWVSLEHMVDGAKHIAESLLNKEWQFFRPADRCWFITSDNPVVFSGVAPANPQSEIIMPLHKGLMLVCTPMRNAFDNAIFDAPKSQVKSMNARMAMAAKNRLFASEDSDGLERLAKKYPDLEQRIIGS